MEAYEVEMRLGISQTTCGRLLKRMVENGQIVQEGKGRNTHYYLADYFEADNFIIPAMMAILIVLTFLRKPMEKGGEVK